MELILLTPDKTSIEESTIINKLFADGLQRLHMRKPGFEVVDYRNYVTAIAGQNHSRLVIHACFELYEELKLGGIHLNSSVRNDTRSRDKIKNFPVSDISTSFHCWEEIVENKFQYGYVFISPVFNSISKPGYLGSINLNRARAIKQKFAQENKYCPKIIGLGGVGPEQVKLLHQHGFDGAAVLGSVWQSGDPVAAFKEISAAVTSIEDH